MLTKYMPTTPTMMKGMLKTAAHAIGRAAGKLLFTVGLPFGLLSTAYAEVTLPRIFGDGMVLQRDQTVKVWGWATTESAVEVRLGKLQPVSAPVKDGRWQVGLPPQSAGGPVTMTITGTNRIQREDIYFGDVWVAAGQSNMDIPMERVKERFPDEIACTPSPLIRQFRVPRAYNFEQPVGDFAGGDWKTARPDTILDFSAVGYFFARDLFNRYGVPIGIINNSVGGSPAEGWMSEAALEAFPHHLQKARQWANTEHLEKVQAKDRQVSDAWYAQLDELDPGLQGDTPWYDPQTPIAKWDRMQVPGSWEDTPLGEMDGSVWFQKEFELPANLAGKPARLMLGRIVDADTVWVNGTKVGETGYQYPPRRYQVPADVLQRGVNRITVRIINSAGKGEFVLDKPYWIEVDNFHQNLIGEWHFRAGAVMERLASAEFQEYSNPLGFYNAMLAPMLNLPIKGVIWYQGESNTGNPREYARLLPALIRDWREQWGIGPFPFILVQLANFMEAKPLPEESNWAATREAQRQALDLPNTGMAVAIDLGEWNDIHPTDKKTVGERLALVARKVAYGEKDLVHSGPTPRSLARKKNRLVLTFDNVGGGLEIRGKPLQGFAIAGEDGQFVWANASIRKDQVLLWHRDVKSPVTVRYAWADNPAQANLYNREGLPAGPFQLTLDAERAP